MKEKSPLSQLDLVVEEMGNVLCVEMLLLSGILYTSGQLSTFNARESCPVIIIDFQRNKIKKVLATRNKFWISALKRKNYHESKFLIVGGDQKMLDFYFISQESSIDFKISITKYSSN